MYRFTLQRMIDARLVAPLIIFLSSPILAAPGDTVRTFPSPSSCPQGLTFDGQYLWCADRKTDMIYKVDPRDGSVRDSFPTPGYVPRGLTWDGRRLWCVDAEEELIYAINPATQIVERTIYCPVSRPGGLAWDGHHLWIADYGADMIHQISSEDGTTIVSIPAPSSNPRGLTFDGAYLWVSDRIDDKIYMITLDKGDVIISFKSPGPHSWGLAWDGIHLWNVDYQTDLIYKVVRDDGTPFSRLEEKTQRIEFIHQVRNYGPGSVKTLDAYMAIPQNLNSQELLEPVTFEPEPTDILSDKWGQQVAHFQFADLSPTEFTTVTMQALVKLYKTRYYVKSDWPRQKKVDWPYQSREGCCNWPSIFSQILAVCKVESFCRYMAVVLRKRWPRQCWMTVMSTPSLRRREA